VNAAAIGLAPGGVIDLVGKVRTGQNLPGTKQRTIHHVSISDALQRRVFSW
jgi:hypothetical protein